jgi:hypothetical protein
MEGVPQPQERIYHRHEVNKIINWFDGLNVDPHNPTQALEKIHKFLDEQGVKYTDDYFALPTYDPEGAIVTKKYSLRLDDLSTELLED